MLSALTTRGRGLLAAGLGCALAAYLVGELDLLRLAAFLVALPLLALLLVRRARHQLDCERVLQPARVGAGASTNVQLTVTNEGRLPTLGLLVEESLPATLGERPRFVLDRVPSAGRRTVNYALEPSHRGRYPVGPLGVRLTDPFGLVDLERTLSREDCLVVTPRVVGLADAGLGAGWLAGGSGRTRGLGVGEDEIGTREYRRGDDLRRVHWRSTARYGELMVRREEQPGMSEAVIALDNRIRSHAGYDEDSSLEWAVSAAASLAVHLGDLGHAVSLVDVDGRIAESGQDPAPVLDALADVTGSPARSLAALTDARTGQADGGQLLVAVLGLLDADDLPELTRLRGRRGTAVALLADVDSWHPGRPGALDLAARRMLLHEAGWRVAVADAGTPLGQVWQQAAAGEDEWAEAR